MYFSLKADFKLLFFNAMVLAVFVLYESYEYIVSQKAKDQIVKWQTSPKKINCLKHPRLFYSICWNIISNITKLQVQEKLQGIKIQW